VTQRCCYWLCRRPTNSKKGPGCNVFLPTATNNASIKPNIALNLNT
jgi:hypothetical protein